VNSTWQVSLVRRLVLTFRMEQFVCRHESGGCLNTGVGVGAFF